MNDYTHIILWKQRQHELEHAAKRAEQIREIEAEAAKAKQTAKATSTDTTATQHAPRKRLGQIGSVG